MLRLQCLERISEASAFPFLFYELPKSSHTVIGYLDATTAPNRRFGIVSFVARRAKELGADAVIILNKEGQPVGSVSTGSSFTNVFGNTAMTTGNSMSFPIVFGKAAVIMIKWVH